MACLAYLHLDCLDGKQARRTSSSSPLGQLFDHGAPLRPVSCPKRIGQRCPWCGTAKLSKAAACCSGSQRAGGPDRPHAVPDGKQAASQQFLLARSAFQGRSSRPILRGQRVFLSARLLYSLFATWGEPMSSVLPV